VRLWCSVVRLLRTRLLPPPRGVKLAVSPWLVRGGALGPGT
jgi:hypothetical protein